MFVVYLACFFKIKLIVKTKIMKYIILQKVLLIVSVCVSSFVAQAQLQVSKLFNNGAILQRDVVVPIWGKANAEDSVFVSIGAVIDTVVSDINGNWDAEIPAYSSGGPYSISVRTNSEQEDFSDIYFGDVWLAAGQSNMEWPLSNSDGGASEVAAANDALLREFKIQKGLSAELADELPSASWSSAASTNVGNFSGVAYFFAKELRTHVDVPIGIVNNSYGGARIEAYMSEEMLGYDEEQVVLQGGTYQERQPTLIYNKMMNPILRFPFKGIIWYQGESNADNLEDAKAYGELFKKMITSWREEMGQGDIPFIWVQLPNTAAENIETSPNVWDAWPQLRAGQSRALSLPNTGEATIIELGDVDIHPTDKRPVGERLALIARNIVYGEDIVYSGPRASTHSVSGDTVIIDFNYVEGGLVGDANDSLSWFSIAGADGVLYSASAVIDGDQVKVWSNAVSSPTIVRYAWEQHPAGIDFYNAEGLPAAPFYIHVGVSGFSVTENFESQTVERGNRVDLDWTVFGASSVTINGVSVYPISSATFYPMVTTDYTIEAINAADASDVYTTTVTVTVIDPQPTVSISTDQGAAVSPNTTVTISADANAPGGGTVTQVEFLIDGVSVFVDDTAPYSVEWTPTEIANYELTAEVTDANGNSTTSAVYTVMVTNLDVLILEAEDATITGDGSIVNLQEASGGKYVDVQSDWEIAFETFTSTTAGTYTLSIRYLLNYESPKGEFLYVNGVSQGEVMFTAPDAATWMTMNIDIPIIEGENTISFDESWGWMSFDYVSLAAEPGVFSTGSPDSVTSIDQSTQGFIRIYPNCVDQELNVQFSNSITATLATVQFLSVMGIEICKIKQDVINGQISFDTSNIPDGTYFLKIENEKQFIVKKILVKHNK